MTGRCLVGIRTTVALSLPPQHLSHPRNPATLLSPKYKPDLLWLSGTGRPSIASLTTHMAHSLLESNWTPPPVDSIVRNIDRIYAGGLFWRVVSPQLLERQSRLMSAIALMAEKLKTALPPDQLQQEGRRRYAVRFNHGNVSLTWLHRSLTTPPSPQTERDALITRHRCELRLYIDAVKRAERKSMLDLDPTAANITLVYNQLTTSLEFWEDAKFWYGMPWWRKPRLDFPWAPPSPTPETLDNDPPERLLLASPRRVVTFGEGEKDSSPKAPALTRVPRCPSPVNPDSSAVRAFRPRAKLISV